MALTVNNSEESYTDNINKCCFTKYQVDNNRQCSGKDIILCCKFWSRIPSPNQIKGHCRERILLNLW